MLVFREISIAQLPVQQGGEVLLTLLAREPRSGNYTDHLPVRSFLMKADPGEIPPSSRENFGRIFFAIYLGPLRPLCGKKGIPEGGLPAFSASAASSLFNINGLGKRNETSSLLRLRT